MTKTCAGSTANPLRADASAAIASRSAGRPGERRVVGRPGVERSLGRLADVRRRVEIGLADLQVDDRATLRLERAGAGGDLEGALGAEGAHPGGETHGRDLRALGQHLAQREPDVRRALREAPHVPRVPMLAVGDERLDAIARARQPVLLVGPDPVQHLDLEGVALDAGRADLLGDLLDQGDVVGAEAEPDRPVAAVEQEPDGETDIVRIDAPPARVGDRFLLVVGALDQADGGVERAQALEVGGRPPKVRLEADPRPRLDRAETLVQ